MQLFNYGVRRSEGIQRAGLRCGSLLVAVVLFVACGVGGTASAKTITVSSGQSINSVINASTTVAGDIVVVPAGVRNESIVLNKSIRVQASAVGAVTLRPGGGRGVDIQCSNCAVIGFRFENFEQAAATDVGVDRSTVTLQDLTFRNVGAGIWVQGWGWRLERIDMEFRCRTGEDYINAFGSNHTFRRLFLWGLQIPGDIGPRADGTYKHSDLIQTFVAGGMPGIKNSMVEECIFTDFAEGIYFHNEAGTQDAINGNIVRNNVFWGTDFASQEGTNLVGGPVHTTRFTGPSSSPGQIRNNIYHNVNLGITTDRVAGVVVEGNIIDNSGAAFGVQNMTATQINKGTLGNLYWANNYDGGVPGTVVNPQFRNPSAIGRAVIGPDGIPWTADDAWRPLNSSAAAFGPQVASSTAPATDTTPPMITLNGVTPMTIILGSTYVEPAATAIDDQDGEVVVTISGTVNTALLGTYTRTYAARDTAGNTATKTRTVIVASTAPGTPSMQWVRVRTYDTAGTMTGYAWVGGTTQTEQPTTAP